MRVRNVHLCGYYLSFAPDASIRSLPCIVGRLNDDAETREATDAFVQAATLRFRGNFEDVIGFM